MAPRRKNNTPQPNPDPHAARERDRYAHPIPSREVILGLLEAADAPLAFGSIAEQLELSEERDLDALGKRLRAMQREGQIISGRRGAYGVPKRMDLLRCRIMGHRDGYGFARPLEGGDDLFLSAREMYQVFDGDEVLVAVAGLDRRGRSEGQIVEVLTRAHTKVVGRYMEESGIGFLLPHNTRIRNHILIPPKAKGGARHGQLVSATLTDYPSAKLGAKGEVDEVLGDHLDPGLEIDVAIRAHGIPWEWPDEVLREAGALDEEPAEPIKRIGSICGTRRLSPSTERMPETSTTRSGARRTRADSSFGSRLRMCRTTCPLARPSTRKRASGVIRCTFPSGSCRCFPRCFLMVCAR